MGSFSIWHWLVVLVLVLVLFGRGKISETMGDFGKGIKSFKQGMNDDADKNASQTAAPPAQIPQQPSAEQSAQGERTESSDTTKL